MKYNRSIQTLKIMISDKPVIETDAKHGQNPVICFLDKPFDKPYN